MKYIYISFILTLPFLNSCVSVGKYNKATNEAYVKGQKSCEGLTQILSNANTKLEQDNKLKTQRLKAFNQIDEQGKLRPLRWKSIKDDGLGS